MDYTQEPVEWTYTYFVKDMTAPIIQAPPATTLYVDIYGDPCMASEYDLGAPIITDNCSNDVVVHVEGLIEYPITNGTPHIVTWYAEDCAGNWSNPSTQEVTVLPVRLRGKVLYNNDGSLFPFEVYPPMAGVEVSLFKASDLVNPLASQYVNNNGIYNFEDLCAGQYCVKVTENLYNPGGVNSTDAGLINNYTTALPPIEKAQWLAGEVNTNGVLDFVDAGKTLLHFLNVEFFPGAMWNYYWAGDLLQ